MGLLLFFYYEKLFGGYFLGEDYWCLDEFVW